LGEGQIQRFEHGGQHLRAQRRGRAVQQVSEGEVIDGVAHIKNIDTYQAR
jgi:hypothetical protein